MKCESCNSQLIKSKIIKNIGNIQITIMYSCVSKRFRRNKKTCKNSSRFNIVYSETDEGCIIHSISSNMKKYNNLNLNKDIELPLKLDNINFKFLSEIIENYEFIG